jgi:flagellar assembly factor FliW
MIMQLESTRFGLLDCGVNDCVVFPEGLIGFEDLRLWTMLSDERLVWLQSLENGGVALPVANPFEYVPDYQIRLAPEECQSLGISSTDRPLVLAVVNHIEKHWTINLHAPILICPTRRVGRQFITLDEQPLRHALPRITLPLRKSA